MFRPIRPLFGLGGKKKPRHKTNGFFPNVRVHVEALEDRTVPTAVQFTGAAYAQNFDSLIAAGTNLPWANDASLPAWSLFRQPAAAPVAITTYNATDGSNNTGSFNSFGIGA